MMNTVIAKLHTPLLDLAELTTYQVGAMQAAANRAVKRQGDTLLKEYGITSMQWHIIGYVLDSGKAGARISDLASNLDTTMAFLTTNVNLLEAKGILTRSDNTHDGRSKMVQVSAAFMPKCQEIEASLRQQLRIALYAKINRDELQTYITVVAKLAELSS